MHRNKDTSFHLQIGCSPITWFNQWNVNGNVTVLLPAFSETATGIKEVCIDVEVNCCIFPCRKASLDRWLTAQSPWTPSMNKEINYCLLSHHNFEGGLFLCTDKLSDIYSLSPAVSRVILLFTSLQFSSVWLLSRVRLCDPLDCSTPGSSIFYYLPEFAQNSYPLSRWCHPVTSSSVIPFSSCPQSFPASGSFSVSQLFASGGQRTGASASASVLPMNILTWFPLGLTGLISLMKNGFIMSKTEERLRN